MASTSSGIINASVGPRIKTKVQEIVKSYPEEYRTVSDFVTKALQDLISKHEMISDNNITPEQSLIVESKSAYGYAPANQKQVIQKLAEISEERAKAAIKNKDHVAAEEHYKEAAEYYKQLLSETEKETQE
jgi:Arc/MetJ-type ribon-helix-helix transcriptional regulator